MLLGFDIGGTKSAVCLGTASGEIKDRTEMAMDSAEAPDSIVGKLVDSAQVLLKQHDLAAKDLDGMGVSCGGPLDWESGTILTPPNLPLWESVPIRTMLESAFAGIRVAVENDANATALAEWKFGAGQGTQNMVFVTMGTGIGAGIILGGQLFRGTNGMAGEVGHQTIKMDGPKCGCGKRGCLEAMASGPAIARLAQESLLYGRGHSLLAKANGRVKEITARHVVEAAKEGDAFSRGILEEAGAYMGIGLANIIQILNPEKIILGTIAVHAGDLILEPIRRAVEEYAWERSRSVCEILPAGLGDRAQDLAAISLAA